jgi:ribosomal protein S27E
MAALPRLFVTCPKCGDMAQVYLDPDADIKAQGWCPNCGYLN